MTLGNDKMLWLLFLLPAVIVPVYIWCFWRKAVMLRKFAESELLRRINDSVSTGRQIFRAVLMMIAFAAIIAALTEPKWNPHPRQVRHKGRDVVILLDTSRSMLAEDIKPNRLERAKIAINDLLDVLTGDRIAIVTFAGNAVVKCPLTQDYAFVRMVLSQISTKSTGRGGTNVGDAIRMIADEVFTDKTDQYRDLILITDCNDQDSYPVQAAEKAGKKGIRIIAIGLGDEKDGARIPIIGPDGRKTFLKYKGREVWAKLDSNKLREIAYATPGGKYLAVQPGTTMDLGAIYEDLIASAQKRELESVTMMKYDEKFQIFIAAAIFFLICETLISERKKTA